MVLQWDSSSSSSEYPSVLLPDRADRSPRRNNCSLPCVEHWTTLPCTEHEHWTPVHFSQCTVLEMKYKVVRSMCWHGRCAIVCIWYCTKYAPPNVCTHTFQSFTQQLHTMCKCLHFILCDVLSPSSSTLSNNIACNALLLCPWYHIATFSVHICSNIQDDTDPSRLSPGNCSTAL